MKLGNKDIKDECIRCGEVLECELCRKGHGIRCERSNVIEMIDCQLRHQERKKND